MILRPAEAQARFRDHPVHDPEGRQRDGHAEIARPPAHLIESHLGVGRQQRQAHLHQDLVPLEGGHHDALEEVAGLHLAAARGAPHHQRRVERRRGQAPFRRGVRIGEAAAEGAARPDGIMGDMPDDLGEEPPGGPGLHRLVESRVPHARPDDEFRAPGSGHNLEPFQAVDPVDVDEVRGPGEPKRHGRHQRLPPGQNLPILQRGEQRQGFLDGGGGVVGEGGGFHGGVIAGVWLL